MDYLFAGALWKSTMNHFASFGCVLKKDALKEDTPTPTNTFVEEELPTLHRAAAKGDITLLASAIKQDARKLEERSPAGLTPLAQAVQCQQLKAVNKLIQMGADINVQDNIGRTCLSVAAYQINVECEWESDNRSQGWHEGVVCLLHHGAKRNICDNAGRSPLHAATYHSDTNTLSILLNSLSIQEINHPDNEIMTAVHWAAFHDRPEHLMQLIQKKADVFARDIDGKLPLHWAAQNGSFQCVHRLTSLPDGLASVNDQDQSGKSPAHYAAAAGSANILTILSHCDNIDLEMEDPDERTPLHWAAAMGHTKAAETLLKLGVNPFVTDVDGYTPLEYARQAENPECLKMMEAHLGKRGSRASFGGLPASGKSGLVTAEEKYRYRKPETPPPEYVIDMPNIKVLPPTATQTQTNTKTTTNKTGAMTSKSERDPPRMYSASTDTDNLDYPAQLTHRPNHNNNHNYHHHDHHNHNHHHHHHHHSHQQHQHQNETNEQKIYSISDHANIFGQLVGSSFLAGAQAPFLSSENTTDDIDNKNNKEPVTLQPTANEVEIWAQHSGHRPMSRKEKEPVELKLMTSQNTPDLNRVSVKSFRSIPPNVMNQNNQEPAIDSNQTPRKGYPPEHENKRNELALLPVLCDVTSPRIDDSWMSMIKTTAPPAIKQVVTAQPQPHDFMTDNNAETRILTRMLKSTLGKVNPQPPSHFHALHGTAGDKEGITKLAGGHPSVAAVLQQKRAREHRATATAATALHTKHSRIPSTKLAMNTNKNNPQNNNNNSNNYNPRAPMAESSNIHLKSGFGRSPSGLVLTCREKYLEEDHVTKPVDPKPLISIHLPGSGRGKTSDKLVDLPSVHHNKSKSKNKKGDALASKSRHGLEKLSSRFGGGGGAAVGGGGGVGADSHHPPIVLKNEVRPVEENVIKMPPIHKEAVQKNLRRVRIDKKIQQVAFS